MLIIYTKTGCPWCRDALTLLREKKVVFEEREVLGNPEYFDELRAKIIYSISLGEFKNLGEAVKLKPTLESKLNSSLRIEKTVKNAVHFLDNVIDMSRFPLKEITEMVSGNRKIGLGVMGFADMLALLRIPYESKDALKTAGKIMKFINKTSHSESVILGYEKGNFPNFQKSIWNKKTKHMRNCACTTIAPTGTISIIAGCSSGIEPLFALAFVREVLSGKHLFEVNKIFESVAIEEGIYSEELMEKIAVKGNLKNIPLPIKIKNLFKTALEISPKQHVIMQAEFQKYTDNAVSKTINLPKNASEKDVKDAYLLAYKNKCKGLTLYRYGSRPQQVLYLGKGKKTTHANMDFSGGTCIGKICSF